jgi:hypothetical protein
LIPIIKGIFAKLPELINILGSSGMNRLTPLLSMTGAARCGNSPKIYFKFN